MGTLAVLRDLAVIVIALVDAVLLAGLAVVLLVALRWLPTVRTRVGPWLEAAQAAPRTVHDRTDAATDAAVRPLIRGAATSAAVERFVRVLLRGV